MKQIAISVAVALLLSACDGGFRYHAQIKSSAGIALTDCNEQLEDMEGKVLSGPFPIDPPKLSDSMTVAPFDGDYILVLSCKDHSPYKARVKYGSEVLPGKDLELGEVTMEFKGRT